MIDLLLIIGFCYLFFENRFIKAKLNSDLFIQLAKGNNRLYRGFWKVNPNDYEKIALDTRTHQKIADEYGISRSRVGAIKQDYYSKREQEGKEIVSEYFKKLPFEERQPVDYNGREKQS